MAPGLRSVERGVSERWAAMLRCVGESVTGGRGTALLAALWLSTTLQISGLRPKAAWRGALPQSARGLVRLKDGREVWKVEVRWGVNRRRG